MKSSLDRWGEDSLSTGLLCLLNILFYSFVWKNVFTSRVPVRNKPTERWRGQARSWRWTESADWSTWSEVAAANQFTLLVTFLSVSTGGFLFGGQRSLQPSSSWTDSTPSERTLLYFNLASGAELELLRLIGWRTSSAGGRQTDSHPGPTAGFIRGGDTFVWAFPVGWRIYPPWILINTSWEGGKQSVGHADISTATMEGQGGKFIFHLECFCRRKRLKAISLKGRRSSLFGAHKGNLSIFLTKNHKKRPKVGAEKVSSWSPTSN